jgi:hypothetical protein
MSHLKRIANRELADGHRQVIFEVEWREGFVGRALTIEIDGERVIRSMEFYDAEVGVTRWIHGAGLGATRTWETENDAPFEDLALRQGSRLLTSEKRGGYRPQHVEQLEDPAWTSLVRTAMRNPTSRVQVPDEHLVRRLQRRISEEQTPVPEERSWWRRLMG